MLLKISIYSIHNEKNVFGNVFQIDMLVFINMNLCVWYVCLFLKNLSPVL